MIKLGDSSLNTTYSDLVKELKAIENGPVENRVERVDSDRTVEELQQMYEDSLTMQEINVQEEFVENTSRIRNIKELAYKAN